jgi:hypothetical protein
VHAVVFIVHTLTLANFLANLKPPIFRSSFMQKLTVSSSEYGLVENVANHLATKLHMRGARVTNLDPEDLLQAVRWPTRDDPFIAAMSKLLKTIDEQPITPLARLIVRGAVLKALKNRKARDEYIQKHPDVLEVMVEEPIFIVGFPRTGTTATQTLLASHPDVYAPPYWQIANPFPLRYGPRSLERIARMFRTWLLLRPAYLLAPEQSDIHEILCFINIQGNDS